MKIPAKILRRMRYYKERRVDAKRVIYSEFILVMPWYMRNITFRIPWTFVRKETDSPIYKPSDRVLDMRLYLADCVELKDMGSAAIEAKELLDRVKAKVKH